MLRVLNVLNSDKKFIDLIIDNILHASAYAENHFCYCGNLSPTKIASRFDLIKVVKPFMFIDYIISEGFQVIAMQTLNVLPLDIIAKIPQNIKVIWHSWGTDIYTIPSYRPLVKLSLYHKYTLWHLWKNWKFELSKLHGKWYSWQHREEYERAINRVDYFSGILPEEYDLVKNNKFFRAQPILFSVGSLDLEQYVLKKNTGNNIIVGNSGDPTNNHIDVYEKLSHISLGNIKVYSFLSYGGNEHYVHSVLKAGKKLLGNNFSPIIDFLPIEDYEQIVSSCGHVIMFHERQQALGNIISAIRNSCKVYLSETSVIYKSFTNAGMKLFSIQKELTAENLSTQLSQKEAQFNFEVFKIKMSPSPLERLINIYKKIELDINC